MTLSSRQCERDLEYQLSFVVAGVLLAQDDGSNAFWRALTCKLRHPRPMRMVTVDDSPRYLPCCSEEHRAMMRSRWRLCNYAPELRREKPINNM